MRPRAQDPSTSAVRKFAPSDLPTKRAIAPDSPEWDPGLNEASLRPAERLYVSGRPLPSYPRSIAIVGSRHATAAGLDAARSLATGAAEAGWTVVSGLAVGIDAAAHRAALDAGGRTTAVLGCGIDVEYPRRNTPLRRRIESSGTIVTEYEDGTPPSPWNFPERNRLIVALSYAVVFVEGTGRSGGMITARLGLDANRHVYAVPGSYRNAMAEGPNLLLRRSEAGLVTEIEHVFEELAPELVGNIGRSVDAEVPDLSDEERDVLMVLDDAPLTVDELRERLGHPTGRVVLGVSRLEARGYTSRRRGMFVISTSGARTRKALAAVDPATAD